MKTTSILITFFSGQDYLLHATQCFKIEKILQGELHDYQPKRLKKSFLTKNIFTSKKFHFYPPDFSLLLLL